MRSNLVVVLPPVLDQHPGLKKRLEEFHIGKLVPQLPVDKSTHPNVCLALLKVLRSFDGEQSDDGSGSLERIAFICSVMGSLFRFPDLLAFRDLE